MNDLPGILADIADVAGEEAAIAVAKALGGTRVYIPPVPRPDHWLSQLIGHEAACILADRLTCGLAGVRVDLPAGPAAWYVSARAQVDRMIEQGRSERDIALATRYTTRGIRKRRALKRDRDQYRLL